MGFFDFLKPKAIDPVCKMQVVKTATTPKSTYNGVEYFFCAEGCKTTFDAEPQKYVQPQTPATPVAPTTPATPPTPPAPPAAPVA